MLQKTYVGLVLIIIFVWYVYSWVNRSTFVLLGCLGWHVRRDWHNTDVYRGLVVFTDYTAGCLHDRITPSGPPCGATADPLSPSPWLHNVHWCTVWCYSRPANWTPANKIHWPNVVSMLFQRRRRWSNIETTLGQGIVLAGQVHNQQDI